MNSKKRAELVDSITQLVNLLSEKEKELLVSRIKNEKEGLPISIFNGKLSGLEAIVVYLRDEEKKSVKEIAELLKRKKTTIYTTLTQAKKKFKGKLDCSDSFLISVSIFAKRKFSVLESLVAYLRKEGMTIIKIASLLNKSPSTIKTVSGRYKEKCR